MYIVNHVFLPPKLPQQDDTNAVFDKHLINETVAALNIFRDSRGPDSSSDDQKRAIDLASDGLMSMLGVHQFGTAGGDATLDMTELEAALKHICGSGKQQAITLPNQVSR